MTNDERIPKVENRTAPREFRIWDLGVASDFGIRISELVLWLRAPCLFLALVMVALMSSGCAGYRLGPTNGVAAQEKSVQIVPFSNQTLEPRLGDAVTVQMRKQLQRDGTYKLATHEDGDILVSGVVTRYRRQELSFIPTDVLTVRDYRLSLTAQVTARERVTDKVIFDQPVTGYTLIRVGADLTSTERQALPLLAGELAKNVTALLVDGGW
jgi:hypothetical protein